MVFSLSAMLNLVVPQLDRAGSFAPALLGIALMIAGFVVLGSRQTAVRVALVYGAGLATLAAFLLPGVSIDSPATLATVTALSSMAVPSLLVAVADRRSLPVVALASFVPVLVLAVVVTAPSGRAPFVAVAVVGGWMAMTFAGLWLARSVRRADTGVDRLREGYAAERRSTETEAELRYGARMLHDTVLATLTVIAHSGVGVRPAALREQAAADSALLAQLRTAGTLAVPMPVRPESEDLPESLDSQEALGALDSLDSLAEHPQSALHAAVETWCAARDFSVTWYGRARLAATSGQLDALTLAVIQCLENVRRHSGETVAEITVSEDEALVRVVVTDTGTGFERALVPAGRLGLAESVEARIAAAGGVARVFSSPGRGTTVLLEVPR
ncbi:hypothetical protein B7R21_14710 [Subtercola boreus]|uniref:Histidine kinase/HSP90-like ATPase domain-containing protein n=1 Tax=Subtercola boreus TaxID=120213 RepID=A0A3E0VCQ9_9MICO|nr:sensor histidine kinase [Subtercola boreus]RFA07445.1 hypothetical protein B7R21_14710 [Subtercola boreus]